MKYLLSLTILLLATQAHADRCKIYKYKFETEKSSSGDITYSVYWSSHKIYGAREDRCFGRMYKKLKRWSLRKMKAKQDNDNYYLHCEYTHWGLHYPDLRPQNRYAVSNCRWISKAEHTKLYPPQEKFVDDLGY